jgi:hypothetical protein
MAKLPTSPNIAAIDPAFRHETSQEVFFPVTETEASTSAVYLQSRPLIQ